MDISSKWQKRFADSSLAPVNSKLNISSFILRSGKFISVSQLLRNSHPKIASVRICADNNTTWSNCVSLTFISSNAFS